MSNETSSYGINIKYPLNIELPLPVDPRQFFKSYEDAIRAVEYAVPINIVKDGDGVYVGFSIPSEEEGGLDSLYYFGEPIVVLNDDGTDGVLYIIVKDSETQRGTLQRVGNPEDCYTREETDTKISEAISNLDSDIITGFIFTQEYNNCGDLVNLNGLYKRGLKETDGILQLLDEKELVIQFDRTYPYTPSNPLATVKRVNIVSDKLDNTRTKVDALEEEIENLKAGLATVIDVKAVTFNGEPFGDFKIEGTMPQDLYFKITSSYMQIEEIHITCNETTQDYIVDETNMYLWGRISDTSVFNIVIDCTSQTVEVTKTITFVLASAYGIISAETQENMENLLTYYGEDMLFKHAHDINGLDYIHSYFIYGLNNIGDVAPKRGLTQVARGYMSVFDTFAEGGLDVNERFYVVVPSNGYSTNFRYLCYVKNDPCKINEFKQTFVP